MKSFSISLLAAVLPLTEIFAAPDLQDAGELSQAITAVELGSREEFIFTHRISNTGNRLSTPRSVSYYLTTDTKVDADVDIELGRADLPRIAVGENVRVYAELTMPITPPGGTFYVGWIISLDDDDRPDDNDGYHPTELSAADPPLLGICFLRGALEGAVEGIGDGEKGLMAFQAKFVTPPVLFPIGGYRAPNRRSLESTIQF